MSALLVELNNVLTEFYDKMSSWEQSVVKETGYSLAQIHTLEVLGAHGAMKMKELASHLSITTGTLTVQVDKLVKAGLIERQFDELDRRLILVGLTKTGQQVFIQHHQLHLNLTSELARHLNLPAQQKLIDLIKVLNRAF